MCGGETPYSFTRVLDLPAALADAWGWHGVSIDPTFTFRCNVGSAAVHPVRIDIAAHFTNSDFL